MAFDQTTRNRLARFVSDTRTLLTEEFTRQLQNEYGLDPASGEVTPIERLTALDDRRRETAQILRETLDYYLAGNPKANAKAFQDVLDRIVREQAFTVLNRLCAFRMSEARGLVLESIAKGYQSKGFQLYARLAGSALGETGEAYRSYLLSLMDEFAVDLPVLFDRFSPQGRLFPREAALLKLLELINDAEIDPLWSEDETIGWIYQYFNSKEERKAMRDASQAPRNSRELAVRNQFFTPRYVVEFLTDNTLGRIWNEMARGETALKDICRYLVRRPNEIFLNEGEEAPAQAQAEEDLSQEELLKLPVYIPHRPIKDPRELKMLDPACGSMHFGLYAFDLFEQIYAEAWELEERLGEDALQRLADLEPLHKSYHDKESYLKDVPRLIIERNIHGVDIDPRAVQIAGLSLWLRAQKSWQAQGLRPSERPQICKSNVVCAEPMPGDRRMLGEFLSTLRGEGLEALMRKSWRVPAGQKVRATPQMADALAKLVRTVWQEMELAGEAGSLLKIEETLREAIATARKESEEKSPLFRVLEYGLNEPAKEKVVRLVSGEEQNFFDRAEGLVLAALREYTEQAENGVGYRRRLFAGDVVQGFALIDLSQKLYDVIVMNPPYGDPVDSAKAFIESSYPFSKYDLYACFVDRFCERLAYRGALGALTSRTGFLLNRLKEWRLKISIKDGRVLDIFADLGYGVLDAAMVQTAAYVILSNSTQKLTIFKDARNVDVDEKSLEIRSNLSSNNTYFKSCIKLSKLSGSPFAYWISNDELSSLIESPKIGDLFQVKQGIATADNERFLRLLWEIPPKEIGEKMRWSFYNKGGESRHFYFEHHLLILWNDAGKEIKAYADSRYGSYSRTIKNEMWFYQSGLSFPLVSKYFCVRALPKGFIFDMHGPSIFADNENDLLFLLGYLNTKIAGRFLSFFTDDRSWQVLYVQSIPVLNILPETKKRIGDLGQEGFTAECKIDQNDETSIFFKGLRLRFRENSIKKVQEYLIDNIDKNKGYIRKALSEMDRLISEEFDSSDSALIIDEENQNELDKTEVFSTPERVSFLIVSFLLGCFFGRWDIRLAIEEDCSMNTPNPFDSLPVCSPGVLVNDQFYPVEQQDVSKDYPLNISWSGILVDDKGYPEDVENLLRFSLQFIWPDNSESIERELCQFLNVSSLRDYFRKPTGFFSEHIKLYSKSRRVAPIYWPLSTPTCSYTLWLYYHRLNDQTLYTCVNNFVDPKFKQVSDETARLRLKKSRSAADEKELERLTDFERELKDFREELLRVAKFWKPNLNDGVEITAAPLWKLFQHKPWQKRLKETWQKLEAGEYDWAHLAYSIWSERVREKCKTDKSLAIAHDLESLYVEPPVSAKKKKAKKQISDEESEGWFNDD